MKTVDQPRRRVAALWIGLLAWIALLGYAGFCLARGEQASAQGAIQLLMLGGWTGYVGWVYCRGCR